MTDQKDLDDMVMNGLLKKVENPPFKEPKPVKSKPKKSTKVKLDESFTDDVSILNQAQELITIAYELIKKAEDNINEFKKTIESPSDSTDSSEITPEIKIKKKRIYKKKVSQCDMGDLIQIPTTSDIKLI
jgi:hypothetical protein